ncbi:MAG: pyrroline-5-carboxylate reductase [bacterium]|nr:pyrroline-5-carboxylate reductase [bacterium]
MLTRLIKEALKMEKNVKIGFIGAGKMASAIIKGLIKTGFAQPENVMATQAELDSLKEKSDYLGIKVISDNKTLVEFADVIFIATKPNQVVDVLKEISPLLTEKKLLVSIAAGVTLDKLQANLKDGIRVIRVMPNTPALVGEGMSGMIGGKYANEKDILFVKSLLETIGKCVVLKDEAQMDIVTAISGSGPAFFYKVINDIARAGEKLGMDYEKALLLSIQTAIGSAKMALNREISMEELISNVATKGGCTRVGVDCMEEEKLDKVFYEVIKSTTEKAHALGQS